jgi:hypothetical protein
MHLIKTVLELNNYHELEFILHVASEFDNSIIHTAFQPLNRKNELL